ncbi:unnamed protein product [Ectocarpus sp. CCAP 1310/34]|nr:unnamed protein product [Ectocarpus sp. CCAP 1310/34]
MNLCVSISNTDKESTNALGEERDQQDGETSGGSDGLSWLTQAAGSHKPSAAASGIPSTVVVDSREGDAGADWLAVAKSSGQAKRSTVVKRPSVGAAAPGGWMSSGKLGLPTGDGSDEDQAGKTSGSGGVAKPKKNKKARGSVSATSGPGGWLSAGALGVPAKDESDKEDGVGSDDGQAAMVTIETQTEENIGAVTKAGTDAEKGNASKLPPWAKPWVAPPTPEVKPDTAAEPPPEKQESTGAVGMKERGPVTDEHGDGPTSGGNDGLGWLTQAADSHKPSAAAVGIQSTAMVGSSDGDAGTDWLAVATSSGQAKHNKRSSAVKRPFVGAAAPGGWMSSGKLGLPTGDGSDDNQAGKTSGSGGVAKPKKNKKARGSVSGTGGPGGWLSAGALGVPAKDESDEEEGSGGEKDRRGAAVNIETQTDNDIEAATRGAAEKGDTRKLPPWAKPYVPPDPTQEVVPDTAAESTIEKQKNSDALGQERALEADEGGVGQASGGRDGLGWLTEAANKNTAAATPASSSAPDWLAGAKSRGTTKHNKRSTAAKRASIGSAAPGGWMSSGKLGLATGDDSSDEDQAGKTDRGSAKPRMKKKKQQRRGSVPAAGGPAGWLSSGALGVPAQYESDENGGDSDGGRPLMATTETQTEDNIEAATKTANGPKLPPWAKPWTPPPPEPEAEPGTAPDPPTEQEPDTPGTPDWILASLDPDTEGAAAAPAPGGSPGDWHVQENQAGGGPAGTGGGSTGPDWLQQATAASTGKPANRWRGAATQRPGGGRKAAAQSPLSWMSSMKRRSSMDLNDQGVEEAIAQAKAKTIPGGWLQIGALGAPDAVEEANALEEARAASSLTR